MEFLQSASDVIILIAAVLGAIAAIWKFCINSGKGIKKTVTEAKEKEEKEFNEKVDARITEKVQPMIEQSARTLTASFSGLLDQHLPERLVEHDKETRKKYLNDRQKYLLDIKDEVILEMQERLNSVDTHDTQMIVFSEVLKELLRERILEIYRRNKPIRMLEDHEKIELRKAYESYKSIGGNSYIDGYYETMDNWEVVPDDSTHHNQVQQ